MRWPARLKQVNDVLRLRLEVRFRQGGSSRALRGEEFVVQQAGEGDGAHSGSAALEKLPSRDLLQLFEGLHAIPWSKFHLSSAGRSRSSSRPRVEPGLSWADVRR